MSIKNSFVTLAANIETLSENAITALNSLNTIVSSNSNEVQIVITDANGLPKTISMPTIGALQADINRLNQNLNTLSSVDQRGAIIQPSNNEFKKIIVANLNKEPNPIAQMSNIVNFVSSENFFLDTLMNPLLSVSIDLTGKIDTGITTVLSRRYIVNFQSNEFGVPTSAGLTAIASFNQNFKNTSNIDIDVFENWLKNTGGIDTNNFGNTITYNEEVIQLDYNTIQYQGFFTILETVEDSVNHKMYFKIDTLTYYEVATNATKQLQINDQLIINTPLASTRYAIVEINTNASDIMIRMQIIEGFEPIPVGVKYGMKFYSPIINSQVVKVPIGFNEYNVVFLKAIDTTNFIEGRMFSKGVAFYTNDLTLSSNGSSGSSGNGLGMQQYYAQTVQDFGSLLNDFVDRYIPRNLGVIPNAPVLSDINQRVIQNNKYLTDTTTVAEQRNNNQLINNLRSKINENNITIQAKQQELIGKNFKNVKDKNDVQNQITKLTQEVQSDTALLQTTVNQLNSSITSDTTVEATYEVQLFWEMPAPVTNGSTRPQEIIAFYTEYKYSNINGQESDNQTFKVTETDGVVINAIFSPWIPYWSPLRVRSWDTATQSYQWVVEDLSSIDRPNINSIRIPLRPNESVTIRTRSVSEVGYPDSILMSDFSDELTVSFPVSLIQPRNPQEIYKQNANLETLRTTIESGYSALGLNRHLSDSTTINNKYYAHLSDNISTYDSNGNVISLSTRLTQLATSPPVQAPIALPMLTPWVNRNSGYSLLTYYLNEGRVYLSGNIMVDLGDKYSVHSQRFPSVNILSVGNRTTNTNYSRIAILPIGYRPSTIQKFIVATSAGIGSNLDSQMGSIEIYPNGVILGIQINSSFVSLDGISFIQSK